MSSLEATPDKSERIVAECEAPQAPLALEMLAKDFATEKIMLDHGFTSRLLIGLLRTKACYAVQRAPKSRQQHG